MIFYHPYCTSNNDLSPLTVCLRTKKERSFFANCDGGNSYEFVRGHIVRSFYVLSESQMAGGGDQIPRPSIQLPNCPGYDLMSSTSAENKDHLRTPRVTSRHGPSPFSCGFAQSGLAVYGLYVSLPTVFV